MKNFKSLPTTIKAGRLEAEKVLNNVGIDFSFIGASDSNGISVYYRVGDVKVRFSDHGITNSSRMANEVCFKFGANEFTATQSILKLRYEMNDEAVEYGQIDYVTSSGQVLKAHGYKLK